MKLHLCPLCEATCGLSIDVGDGDVKAIRGDRQDPLSRGYVCAKGVALRELQVDGDRLTAPVVRRDGRHVPVSWDEAFADIAARIAHFDAAHGRQSLALYLGNPNVHNPDAFVYGRALLRMAGTQHVYSASTLDQAPKQVACGMLFGDPFAVPVPDIDRTDLLVILGGNPMVSHGSLWTVPDFPARARALRERGGRIVVVDPVQTATARIADEHLPIRPGTDAALLAAVCRGLLASLRCDRSTVDGLDALAAALSPFTPERVAPWCGLRVAAIERLTEQLLTTERAVVYGRMGTCTVAYGTLTSALVDLVNLLSGHLDREGGAMFPEPAHTRVPGGREKPFRMGRWRSRVRGLPEVMGELPAAALLEEMGTPGEGQVRGLVTVAGNPARSAPGGERWDAALAGLDLMVSLDPYLNETTRHADVILPPPPPLSRPMYDFVFGTFAVRNVARWSPATLPMPAGGIPEGEIFLRLLGALAGNPAPVEELDDLVFHGALAMELGRAHWVARGLTAERALAGIGERRGIERMVDLILRTGKHGDGFGVGEGALSLDALIAAPHGVDLGPPTPRLGEVLKTPSGRVDAAPAAILGELGRLAGEVGEAGEAGRILLVGRRHVRSNNSWMHNLPSLVRGDNRCTLWIHPEDAAALGLGTTARVRSADGELVVAVEPTPGIARGVVSLPHGWGHGALGSLQAVASATNGVNSNVLASATGLEGVTGTAVLNGISVVVEAVGG